MLKTSKILLSLITLYITIKCSEIATIEIIRFIRYDSFSSKSIMLLFNIITAIFGVVTTLYHYKTFMMLIQISKSKRKPYVSLISKIYWNGAKGFIFSIILFTIAATWLNILRGNILSSILIILFIIVLTSWMQKEVRKMSTIYNDVIRLKESIVDEIGKE